MSVRATPVDLIVVGGGAMGLATAWHAAATGSVVVLERFALGHDRGASHGGERIFRHAYVDRAYVDMALAAEEGWSALSAVAGRPLIHRVGCVEHGAGTAIDALASVSAAAGVATERLSAREAARRWPALRFAGEVLHQPTAGWTRAADALAALARAASGRGAVLSDTTPVAAVEVLGDGAGDGAGDGVGVGVRVTAADGRAWEAPAAVVAAGAWAATLLPGLAWPPLVTTEEHYVRFRPRHPGLVDGLPAFIHWEGVDHYGVAGPDGLVKVGEHHAGVPTTGDTRTGVPDPVRLTRIERYVAEWVPGLVPEAVAAATCLYTTTPTQGFVLDRVGPLVVATGFSGHGFKFVPEVGRRLAALAAGTEAPTPPFTLASHARA